MKLFRRVILVFVGVTLAMIGLAHAQNISEDALDALAEAAAGTVEPVAPSPFQPAPAVPDALEPPRVSAPIARPMLPSGETGRGTYFRGTLLGTSGRKKVLVIPSAEVKAEDLANTMQDLRVMSHIFEKRFQGAREIGGVFVDFGDFFGRDSHIAQAIYLQGYAALFLMEGSFPLSPPPGTQEAQAEKAEQPVDTTWEEAKQEIFSPSGSRRRLESRSRQKYDADEIEELKRELIRTLKHAANIRNIKTDEWIIVTVVGQGQQGGEFFEYEFSEPRTTGGRSRSSSSSYGGFGGYGSYGGSAGGGGFGFGGISSSVTASPSATVLTIRAKKADVDDYAKENISFEQFREKIKILMY